MAALTDDRNTRRRYVQRLVTLPVAASSTIYAGGLVSLNSSGYAIPAADTASTKVVGRANAQADNSSGSNGDINVEVQKGVFKYDNAAGGNAVVQADLGATAEVADDQTVAGPTHTTNNIGAGVIDEIDSDGGIWVAIL